MKFLALIWPMRRAGSGSGGGAQGGVRQYRSFSHAADGKLVGGDELAPTRRRRRFVSATARRSSPTGRSRRRRRRSAATSSSTARRSTRRSTSRRGSRPPSTARSRCGPATSTRQESAREDATLLLSTTRRRPRPWASMSEEEAPTAARRRSRSGTRSSRSSGRGSSSAKSSTAPTRPGRPRPRRRDASSPTGRSPRRRSRSAAYFLIDCDDLDHAIASRRGSRRETGSVEIRPLAERPDRRSTRLPGGVARAVSLLIRVLGDFELAEDAVQDAFATALERWPRDGTPRNRRRVDRLDGAQPRDRPDPARADARAEDRAARAARGAANRARRTT